MSGPGEPLLSVRGLCKTFAVRDGLAVKRIDAVRDVSFELARGEVLALVGESGSGKSTIARLVARLLPATAGAVLLEGRDALAGRRPGREFRAAVQMIFQDPFASLNPVHTVGYHLSRPLLVHGAAKGPREAAERAAALLDTVGLSPAAEFLGKYPHEMSGGQRQRVAIARALAAGPRLVLADEPTSMLDVSIRIDVLNLLARLRDERGIGYLFITHDLASARYFSDRILVLYAGAAVESGPSREILASPSHPYTRLLLSAVPDPRRTRVPPAAPSGVGAPASWARGCAFAPRCPEAIPRCLETPPPIADLGGGRAARCHGRAP